MTLEEKINKFFKKESVYKAPQIDNIFSGFNLPSFVKDWLIKRYTDKRGEIDVASVKNFLNVHIANKGSKLKGELMSEQKEIKILARLIIEPDVSSDQFRFSIPDTDIKASEGIVPKHLVNKFQELKGGETWGVVTLAYVPPINPKKKNGVIEMTDFKRFKPYDVNIEYFREMRKEFSTREWIDLIIRSMEYDPAGFSSLQQKLIFISRLLVFVEPNINIMELAPKGTGKSYVFNNLSKYGWVITGGIVTRAKLFYDMKKYLPGIVERYDFVAMDEIETIKFNDENELKGALKNYLESGNFSVGNYRGTSNAGFMLLGNLPLDEDKRPKYRSYLRKLPDFFYDSALLDRFHGFIEGWKLPRIKENLKLKGLALNVEYFSEVLHKLRTIPDFTHVVNSLLEVPGDADTRDTRAIKKISSGYLKLLFPNVKNEEDIENEDFEKYCLQPAKEMRGIIRKQLNLIDPEYKPVLPDIRVR